MPEDLPTGKFDLYVVCQHIRKLHIPIIYSSVCLYVYIYIYICMCIYACIIYVYVYIIRYMCICTLIVEVTTSLEPQNPPVEVPSP